MRKVKVKVVKHIVHSSLPSKKADLGLKPRVCCKQAVLFLSTRSQPRMFYLVGEKMVWAFSYLFPEEQIFKSYQLIMMQQQEILWKVFILKHLLPRYFIFNISVYIFQGHEFCLCFMNQL